MARYRLLRDACRRRGILHLLLAHHADDQAETVAMRAARAQRSRRPGRHGGSGRAAGRAPAASACSAVSRARLTATLVARGVQWIDDPSNVDPRFERARLRTSGVPRRRASGGRRRRERRSATATWRRAAVDMLAFDQAGMAAIDRAAFARLGRDLQARLLSRVVQAVGGRDYPPRRERLERAAGRLCARPLERGKVGQKAGFHAFRLPAHASSGSRTAAGCTGLSGPNMAGGNEPAPHSGCIFRLRHAGRFPSRMSLHSNGKSP